VIKLLERLYFLSFTGELKHRCMEIAGEALSFSVVNSFEPVPAKLLPEEMFQCPVKASNVAADISEEEQETATVGYAIKTRKSCSPRKTNLSNNNSSAMDVEMDDF